MKTVRDVMIEEPVTIGVNNRVKTAVLLMKGHHIGALPVVGVDMKVVGMLSDTQLLGEQESTLVTDVMDSDYVHCPPETSIAEAAERMSRAGKNHILVMEDNNLLGVISDADLVPEVGKAFDPLTGMPWADTFRSWAIKTLRQNIEVSVIFLDLDDFGLYNKKYGHVVGDSVLKAIAEIIDRFVDKDSDCACRYGGDEFAIVSIRRADEAEELADEITSQISKLRIKNVPEGVSASYGLSGGRRTREREDTHYAATVDNLITRASKECTRKKQQKLSAKAQQIGQTANTPTQQPQPQIQPTITPMLDDSYISKCEVPILHDVVISTTKAEYTALVTISAHGQIYSGTASKPNAASRGLPALVAEAAAVAVNMILSPGYSLGIEEVVISEVGKFEDTVTVLAVLSTPTSGLRFPATTLAQRGDCMRPVANAVIEAIGKQSDAICSIPSPSNHHSAPPVNGSN